MGEPNLILQKRLLKFRINNYRASTRFFVRLIVVKLRKISKIVVLNQ